jgi:antitoxin MazE
MKTSVQKWGNSLALRIPKAYAAGADLVPGAEVELSLHEGALVVTPVRRRVHSLKNLLRQIKPGNLHAAVDSGGPVGNEAL